MTPQIQVRVTGPGKAPDRVDGPDDAAVVISISVGDAGLDPTVAYMQGRLKAVGHTGVLFEALSTGAVERAIRKASGN